MKTLLLALFPLLFFASACTTLTARRDLYNPDENDGGPYHRKLDELKYQHTTGCWWFPSHPKAIQSGKAAYLEEEG